MSKSVNLVRMLIMSQWTHIPFPPAAAAAAAAAAAMPFLPEASERSLSAPTYHVL